MRKREVVWEDPRFRSKKQQPKALKINKFGEAPCSLPPAHVPAYATASIPSGMTSPPCPRPAAPSIRRAPTCRRPPPAKMATGPGWQQPARPPSGMAPRPPTAAHTPVVVATRPPSQAAHGGARPKQMMYRPGTAAQRPCPQPAPPCPQPCPPPAAPCPQPCPPPAAAPCPRRSFMYQPRPSSGAPCPPPASAAPCPPSPCPSSPPQRQSPCAPCAPQQSIARFSGLPRRSGLRPPAGRSGLRPPTATHATSLVARRPKSPEPCPPPPCPPPPCPPDPCPSESRSLVPCPPQVSTPQPRRPMAFQGGLRPPSRLMGPGSFSRPQPKPQKIVLLPGDINPCETTVITVEPPQQPEMSRPCSRRGFQSFMPSLPCDFSPPSMDSFRREPQSCGLPPAPYIPPDIMSMVEAAEDPCGESPSEIDTPQYETSSALLVDIEPFDPCSMEPKVLIEPVDLITFPAPDPFSPVRACRPQSPSVTPPPNPFTPPKDPIPEPSALDKWAAQYPRYKEAYTSSFHPIGEWAKLKYQQKASGEAERELVARSVPFNKNVSTICKDDDDFDDELGLLHCMPDLEENFNAPLDYAAMRRQEEIEREEREARRRERERQERGPSLAETRALLARIRETECARRTEMAGNVMSSCQPPTMTQEEMRVIHDRVISRHAGTQQQQQQQQQQSSDISCLDQAGGYLDDIEFDECDLDAIDDMDDCIDF
ncbi:uncharacterized protein [Halyomorpha halys]|uniref:uncharacterized protein isoform X2 n=1 Tax=Halyomorpha halys TaxID=286706 RepID=UPI0006D4CE46|nr:vegetative cell wall protein gp1-like isoform X2 [Halyomorpha halys]